MPELQAQTADGVIHSFPDGTSPEVMDRAIQNYTRTQTLKSETDKYPQSESSESLPSKALKVGGDVLQGIGEGAFNTVTGVGKILTDPIVKRIASPEAIKKSDENIEKITTPENTAQSVGKAGEQAAEFLIPGEAEEKAALKIGEALPKAPSIVRGAAKLVPAALSSGVINKAQGGSFETGAEAGAAGGALSNAAKAIAPSVAEGALGISRKARMFGKTPGEAVLAETKGIRPLTVATEAGEKARALTGQLEGAAATSTKAATPNDALAIIDSEMAKAKTKNSKQLFDRLGEIRGQLTHDQFTGQPFPATRSATDILNAKRGINDLISGWTIEQKKGIQKVLPQVYNALDKELDRVVPASQKLNQRISSLIPVKQRAQAMSEGAELPQRIAHRLAAHTGALAGAGIGSGVGYSQGGAKGAVIGGTAGLILPELLASPSTQMLGARVLNSPVPSRVGRSLALQLDRNHKKTEETK